MCCLINVYLQNIEKFDLTVRSQEIRYLLTKVWFSIVVYLGCHVVKACRGVACELHIKLQMHADKK